MRNSEGKIVPGDGVSLFHPKYLEKLTRWYDQVMPFLREREISAGGPIIMMQICNEIGVFSWLAHQGDYCEIVRLRFIAHLSAKFKSIAEVNSLWGTDSMRIVASPAAEASSLMLATSSAQAWSEVW